jgi:transcriptional regulator with XRE-family HTH domain
MLAEQTILADSPKGKSVGRKRRDPPGKPKTLREKLAARLRTLAKDRPAHEIADKVGVSVNTVLKWLRAENSPDLEYWPKLADALGLKDYRELLPDRK